MTSRPLARFAHNARHNNGAALKALVWLFSAVLLIVIWTVVVQQIRFERQRAIDEAIAQNVNRAIAFEQFARRTLELASISTLYVASRFHRGEAGAEFLGTPERPALIRGDLMRSAGTFLAVAIANANGDVIAASRRLPGRVSVADNPAFRAHVNRETGELFVSQPFLHPVLRRNAILLTRRLSHPDGSFAGVVSLTILPEQFTAFFRDAQFGPMDMMSLIGLDGVIRARRVGAVTSSGETMRGRGVMRLQRQNPTGTFLGPTVHDGQSRYFSLRPVANYPLFVSYGILESEILAPPRRRARALIAAAGFGSLATLAFVTLLTLLLNRGERRQRDMARANERLQEAQRIGQIGDWEYDLKTGATNWSPQLCAQFERTPEQGSPSFDEFKSYLDEEGSDAVDRAHAEAIRTGETQEVEYQVRLPSGAEHRHQGVVIPTVDATGKVVRLHGTDQNINVRKLLERLQNHVAHLSRVEAMNAMATTLAHELNQPLTAAANYLVGSRRLLATAPADSAGLEEGMSAAEQQILFAGDIIRRVREMVSNQSKTLSNFPLSEVIDDAVALIAGAAGSPRPDIHKQLEVEASEAYADRVQVQQVLINLLRNALQATKNGASPQIVVAARPGDKDMVLVSVSDNGPGFSQPRAGRFSPFPNGSETGMGLGLSISRTIVESNGGRIWTEDREEGGARVCFSLPSARAAPGVA